MSKRFHLGINGVSPRSFEEQLDFLAEVGLQVVPLRGLSESSPERGVTLTFDDGYESFYDEILPILLKRELPATVFIITDYTGRDNRWDVTFGVNRRKHLDEGQIREIAAAGIEIGSHGLSHRDLRRMPEGELDRELRESRQILAEKTGREITSFAIPFGSGSVEIFSYARRAGYREICGGVPGFYGPQAGILPRMPVYSLDGLRAFRRKLEMSYLERFKLRMLQNCSRGTRIIKR